MLWPFNVGGLFKIYANIASIKDHDDPGFPCVSSYLALLNVPAKTRLCDFHQNKICSSRHLGGADMREERRK